MKILMVCTFTGGGAAIAAKRQASALQDLGHQCDFIYVEEEEELTKTQITRKANEIILTVPSSIWSYYGMMTTAYCTKNRTDISNTWFSFWAEKSFLDDALLSIFLKYDVIHFHWITQLVSSHLLRQLSEHKKRVVVTGHDMNHFTGGCHYSAGCNAYSEGCVSCPQLLSDPLNLVANSFYQKVSAFASTPATWLFPSDWLANEFRASQLQDVLSATKVVRNCIDTEKFVYLSDVDRQEKRTAFGFVEHEMVFIAGAADNKELRKGFDYIESSTQALAANFSKNKDAEGFAKHCVIVTF